MIILSIKMDSMSDELYSVSLWFEVLIVCGVQNGFEGSVVFPKRKQEEIHVILFLLPQTLVWG